MCKVHIFTTPGCWDFLCFTNLIRLKNRSISFHFAFPWLYVMCCMWCILLCPYQSPPFLLLQEWLFLIVLWLFFINCVSSCTLRILIFGHSTGNSFAQSLFSLYILYFHFAEGMHTKSKKYEEYEFLVKNLKI